MADEVFGRLAFEQDCGAPGSLELNASPWPTDLVSVRRQRYFDRGGLPGLDVDVLGREFVAIVNDNHGVLPGGQRDRMVAIVDRLTIHKQISLFRHHMNFQLAVLRVCCSGTQHEKCGKKRNYPQPESSYLHFLWPSSGLPQLMFFDSQGFEACWTH